MQTPDTTAIELQRTALWRPTVVLCFVHNNTVLFAHNKKHHLWQFPQGGIEKQESFRDAMERETREELGVAFADSCQFNDNPPIAEYELVFPASIRKKLFAREKDRINYRGKLYYVCVIPTTTTNINLADTEFEDIRWVDARTGLEQARQINQPKKRKITTQVFHLLKEHTYIT